MTDLAGPSVTEAYGFAWGELRRSFLELLVVVLVWILVAAPSGWFRESTLGIAYHALVLGPVGLGGMWAFLRAARGQKPEVADLFEPFRTNYAQSVIASLLWGALIAIGTVLFLVPGIIAAVRLSWVPYLVVDEKMEAVAAVRESWERTRDHGWTIFGIGMLAIPILLVGLLLLGVGVIPAGMWVQLAAATYYAAITARERAARAAGVAPAGPV